MAEIEPTTSVNLFGVARDARCAGCLPAPVTVTNPFAPPPSASLAKPVVLEFETPLLAPPYQAAPPDVWHLLDLAEHGTSEGERRAAVEHLVQIYQQQVGEFRRSERQQVDLPLTRFFERQSLRAIIDAQVSKAAEFLMPPKRGKRASSDIAAGHLRLAGEVLRLVESGHTQDGAIATVASKWRLSKRHVEKIWTTRRWEARAARHKRI